MIVIGLTGSIGMGKTTVAGQFETQNFPSHNSDLAVHRALLPNGLAFEEVAVTFPEAWDKKNHAIRKDILSKLVFNNESKRRELENILHPIVQYEQIKFIRREKSLGRRGVVLDIPLLFEKGANARVDYSIVVTAPYFIQRQRVLKRAGMTHEKFDAILKTQMPDREKQARADFIIHTSLGRAHSMRQTKQILSQILG